jgi:hypothetical protein
MSRRIKTMPVIDFLSVIFTAACIFVINGGIWAVVQRWVMKTLTDNEGWIAHASNHGGGYSPQIQEIMSYLYWYKADAAVTLAALAFWFTLPIVVMLAQIPRNLCRASGNFGEFG